MCTPAITKSTPKYFSASCALFMAGFTSEKINCIFRNEMQILLSDGMYALRIYIYIYIYIYTHIYIYYTYIYIYYISIIYIYLTICKYYIYLYIYIHLYIWYSPLKDY